MKKDPLIAEIRRTRDRMAAGFGFDVRALFAHYQRVERESGGSYVQRGPKRLTKSVLKVK